ncbi:MAG: hypothetical protein K2X48_17380 [Chitinophagaceae bacterium]|nr:hypothetical protein [Chitinophagaceae bacterium]
MKIKSLLFISITLFLCSALQAQTIDSLITKRKKVIKHPNYQKGDWHLSTGVYAQSVLNTFQASSILYATPSASFWHETNQTGVLPLIGVQYMVTDRWALQYLPAIRKAVITDTFTTGTVFGTIANYGQWIIDNHIEAKWFTRPGADMKHNARAYLGAGVSVMNTFQSFLEPKEPALLGRRINVMYGAFTLFGGTELNRRSKLLHGLFIEPRLMIIPAMPRFTVQDRGPYYMVNLRIYKNIFLKNTKKVTIQPLKN